jgi:hypothetical protein
MRIRQIEPSLVDFSAVEDDRNPAGGHLCRLGRRGIVGEKNIHPLLHEFSCRFR